MTNIVRLKPLEWVNHGHDYWYAMTVFGAYSAHAISMASTVKYRIHRPDKLGTEIFFTIDDAKAACESDYRKRIATAFTSPWQPMASAPKDRSIVLTRCEFIGGADRVAMCYWDDDRESWEESARGQAVCPVAWMEIPPLEGK